MNHDTFRLEINKLISEFGEKSYSATKVARIWTHVQDLPDYWFKFQINQLLDTEMYAPRPIKFIEAARRYRSSNAKPIDSTKWQERKNSIFDADQRREMFQFIQDVLNKKKTLQEARQYVGIIQRALSYSNAKCDCCNGSKMYKGQQCVCIQNEIETENFINGV